MLHFFRKMRSALIPENRFGRYFFYALGEIVLVVIGILIALQINNNNQNKITNEQFNLALEQIYTNLNSDLAWQNWNKRQLQIQSDVLNKFIANELEIKDEGLPVMLRFSDWLPTTFIPITEYNLSQLEFNSKNKEKGKLVNQIHYYYNFLRGHFEEYYSKQKVKYIGSILNENSIPIRGEFIGAHNNNFDNYYTKLYSSEDVEIIVSLLETRELKTAIRNTVNRNQVLDNTLGYRISELSSLIQAIETFKPDIKLIYNGVEINGSAVRANEGSSLPMKLMDEQSCTWEIDTKLNEGTIHFNVRKTGSLRWGGDQGIAVFRADGIPVQAGIYTIRFNLSESKYELIRK